MSVTPKDEMIEKIFLGFGLVMTLGLFYFLRAIVRQVLAESRATKAAELAEKANESQPRS